MIIDTARATEFAQNPTADWDIQCFPHEALYALAVLAKDMYARGKFMDMKPISSLHIDEDDYIKKDFLRYQVTRLCTAGYCRVFREDGIQYRMEITGKLKELLDMFFFGHENPSEKSIDFLDVTRENRFIVKRKLFLWMRPMIGIALERMKEAEFCTVTRRKNHYEIKYTDSFMKLVRIQANLERL